MRTQINSEDLLSENTHIRQEDSRFGNIHVLDNIAIQNNFAGDITVSKCFSRSFIYRIIFTISRYYSAIRFCRQILLFLARVDQDVYFTTAAIQSDQNTAA